MLEMIKICLHLYLESMKMKNISSLMRMV